MVITQTPMRMSFLGGGTDYKEFFESVRGGVFRLQQRLTSIAM